MIEVLIMVIPAYLTSRAFYLLVSKSGDDLTYMLFLPKKGPPEIKYLRVTLNQILDELARRSIEPLQAYLEGERDITGEDTSDIGFEAILGSADEDELDFALEESSDTRSEVAAMSAHDDWTGVSDSDWGISRISGVGDWDLMIFKPNAHTLPARKINHRLELLSS